MQRYTRKFIEARFHMAMEVLGVPHGDVWIKQDDGSIRAAVGTYFLDYAPIYGGYCIRKVANEGGAESTPFGSMRYNASTFAAFLGAIMDTVHIMKQGA
jgi:hypothetical protein